MTSVEMIARLRAVLDEQTAGYYQDAELYKFLDSGQNIIISKLLSRQKALRLAKGQIFEIDALKPLLKEVLIANTTSSEIISIASLTDMIQLHSVFLYNSTNKKELRFTVSDIGTLKYRADNTYTGHYYDTTTNKGYVLCALSGVNIITSFASNTLPYIYYDKTKVVYYAQPLIVQNNQNYTIASNLHEAGIYIALGLAEEKNGQLQKATLCMQHAEDIIAGVM